MQLFESIPKDQKTITATQLGSETGAEVILISTFSVVYLLERIQKPLLN